ncbi:MAG: hypothetical protein HY904_22785 [Deltaproteobacteria bacterium]|nr:hypothetical protein [Deltaproteobacteria bacterium]
MAGWCRSTGPFGGGEDGDAVPAASEVNLATASLVGRASADAPSWRVVTLAATQVRLAAAPAGLAPADEVVLITLRGSGAADAGATTEGVGTWETFFVTGIAAEVVTLDHPPLRAPGGATGLDLAGRTAVVVRVPRYRTLQVPAGTVLTTSPFQPAALVGTDVMTDPVGGVLFLRVAGEAHVDGRVAVAGLGFRGGPPGPVYNDDAQQGEGRAGFGGMGAAAAAAYNATNGLRLENHGGGGAYVTGAGGGHGTRGQPGAKYHVTALADAGPEGGLPYDQDAGADTLTPGGGGGGVWMGRTTDGGCALTPGPGGRGGGILALFAGTLRLDGALDADGEAARSASKGSNQYGSGGGAGGALLVTVGSLVTTVGRVHASGGAGLAPAAACEAIYGAGTNRPGGNGGDGVIRVTLNDLNGDRGAGSAESRALLDAVFAPAPQLVRVPP